MLINFFKYQGVGNDFIIIDNRSMQFDVSSARLIERLCDRRFGIGADGLILLQSSGNYDFEMKYYNADGNESSMCGNGGRCIVSFANKIGILKNKTTEFLAIDGVHKAFIMEEEMISLQMSNVSKIERIGDDFYLNTGSPHYIMFVEDVDAVDVYSKGKEIRNSKEFKTEGTNVNFVQLISDGKIKVRTYERGVEDETLSCGTGVTAAAIASFMQTKTPSNHFSIITKGGNLAVLFEYKEKENLFESIFLNGPANMVFEGQINTDFLELNKK